MTGAKGRGKTTLLLALLDGAELPGVHSEAERGPDGLPVRIWLSELGTNRRCVVGRRDAGPMLPVPEAFDGEGAAMLRRARLAPGEWAAVDEIGFLEACSDAYLTQLRLLFDEKRVIAAVRKADTPFGRIPGPSMREKAQPHNPLGHYQKREPVLQSRWSKNGQDHMKDHR